MKRVTAVIISFLRPEYTTACITSIKKTYPDVNILVAENGEKNDQIKQLVEKYGGEYIMMPYDSGVCYARNRLVERVKTEYILVGDDDFFYTKVAGVDKMLAFLEAHPKIPLIGGKISEDGRPLDYQGDIMIYPDYHEYIALWDKDCKKDKKTKLKYGMCDITFNYFLGRSEIIKKIKWDENIKVAYEHSDWFIELKRAGIGKVAYTPEAIVIHKPKHVFISEGEVNNYRKYRDRKSDMEYYFRKHNIQKSIGFKGESVSADEFKEWDHKFYASRALEFEGNFYNVGDIIITDHPADGMEPIY